MLEVKELMQIKARMLLAAETAARIVLADGDPLELDEEQYRMVIEALSALRTDTRAILAEVDILRGMTTGSFDSLFGGTVEHGRSSDVGSVQSQPSVGGGEEQRPDNAGASGPVRSGGPDGEDASRPRPRRNRRRSKKDQESVES